jgi:RNA polymerase sigma-70 factor (ECF subfamily)
MMNGGSIDAFRDDLMRLARREIGTDLAAKVSASDVVQETFLVAGRDIAQFRGEGPVQFRGWLRGILDNQIRTLRRRFRGTGKRRIDREVGVGDAAGGIWEAIAGSTTSPSGCAMREERCLALRSALDALPEHYRQVIRWHHQERLTFEAIADRLDISAEAARKLWARALIRLREALGPDHDPQ